MRFSFSGPYIRHTIKELSVFVKDGTHGSHKDCANGIPLLSAKDIHDGIIDLSNDPRKISESDYCSIYKKHKPKTDDILITIVGTIGRTAIIPDRSNDFAFQRSVGWIRPHKSMYPLYFNYLLQSKTVQNSIVSKTNASAQGGIYLGELEKIVVIIPQLDEQRKIAATLSLIDKKIETQNKIIEDLKLLMKRSIDSLLHLKPQAKNIELRQLLTERKEKNKFALSVFSVAVEEGIVNQKEHLGRSFAAKDTSNYNVVKYGNIVYTKSPTGLFPFGIVKQSYSKEDVAVSPLYGIYEPKTMAIGNYLHYYFLNPINTNNYLHPLVNKGAKNTMNITNQRFLDGKIVFPESYIDSIVGFLTSIKSKFDFNVKLLEKYQLQKKYLLDNLFI